MQSVSVASAEKYLAKCPVGGPIEISIVMIHKSCIVCLVILMLLYFFLMICACRYSLILNIRLIQRLRRAAADAKQMHSFAKKSTLNKQPTSTIVCRM